MAEPDGVEIAIQVDLLRRADHFREAQQLTSALRPAINEHQILQILTFQKTLIAATDDVCHTAAEAIGMNT